MPARLWPMIALAVAAICFALIAGVVFFYNGRDAPKVAQMKPESGPPPAAVAPVIAPPPTVRPGPAL